MAEMQNGPEQRKASYILFAVCFILTWLALGLTAFGLWMPLAIIALLTAAFTKIAQIRGAALSIVVAIVLLLMVWSVWPHLYDLAPQYLWPPRSHMD